MTVKILTAWNEFPTGYVGEVRSKDVEDWLVGIGFAAHVIDEQPQPLQPNFTIQETSLKAQPNKADK